MQKYSCIHVISSGSCENGKSYLLSMQPTPRELEVEELLCRGYSQLNIAAIFGRSLRTISVHVTSLYKKRGVHNQVGLLLAYLERRHISVFSDKIEQPGSGQKMLLEAAR